MSAPVSPRTEAILEAVRRGAPDVATVVDALDYSPPDPGWSTLERVDRAATVRRYLGRLVQSRQLVRLSEGNYASASIYSARPVAQPSPAAADDASSTPSQVRPNGPKPKWTSADLEAGHNSISPTRNPEEPDTMTTTDTPITTDTEPAESDSAPATPTEQPLGGSLRLLLDDCPHAPWSPETYERLDVLARLEARRADLIADREAAQARVEHAEALEVEATVDGRDTTAHAASVATERDSVARITRALAALTNRLRSAALDVLACQESQLLDRAKIARAAIAEHARRRGDLIQQLVDLDGPAWRPAGDQIFVMSRLHTVTNGADRAARLVLALRAAGDDLPLGFDSAGARTVTRGGIGTLSGVGGVPALVEVTTLPLEEHGRETAELVEILEDELDDEAEDGAPQIPML